MFVVINAQNQPEKQASLFKQATVVGSTNVIIFMFQLYYVVKTLVTLLVNSTSWHHAYRAHSGLPNSP